MYGYKFSYIDALTSNEVTESRKYLIKSIKNNYKYKFFYNNIYYITVIKLLKKCSVFQNYMG